MANAPIPLTNVGSGYTIVTQVIPSSTAPTTAEQNSSQTLSPLRKFLKGEPKALGTVQIMNGFLMLLLGIVLVDSTQQSFVYFGFAFWGSFLHILAGVLTVSASRKLHFCGVKGAMAMNILSAITAAISIITLSLDLMFIGMVCYNYDCRSSYTTMSRTRGITGVLLVFSLLQFAVSIAISAFACKATCSNEPTLNIINVVPNPEGYVPSTSHSPGNQYNQHCCHEQPTCRKPSSIQLIKSESDN